MTSKRVVLCGYYGEGNGGDEALLATLLQMLPPQVEPLVLSGNPAETRARYGIAACDRRGIVPVVRALSRSDAFIWGGGSLMQDATSAASPFYYGGLMAMAQGLGLETIAWAQGVGPLRRSLSRCLTRRVLRSCSCVSVRDGGSAQLLRGWQVPHVVAPDPVWSLEASPTAEVWAVPSPRLAVILRPHPDLTPSRLETLIQALDRLQQATGAGVVFIPFQPEQDLPLAKRLQARLVGPSQILTWADPRQLKGLFPAMDMVIAMRFHGLIMAAASSCRCFALSYDPKVTQLMQELSLPGWELTALPRDASVIARVWLEHYAHGQPLARDQIQSLVQDAARHGEILRKVLTT